MNFISMAEILKRNIFSVLVLGLLIFLVVVLRLLPDNMPFKSFEHLDLFGMILTYAFIAVTFMLGIYELTRSNRSVKAVFNVRNLLIIALFFALVCSLFSWRFGAYSLGFFVASALLYFAVNRRLFAFDKVYYLVFAYALLHLMGTITTPKGFHFPEKLYAFFILPLAFSLFNLERNTLMRLLRLFFRVTFVYMAISLFFWQYNLSYSDVSSLQWISTKLYYFNREAYRFVIQWANFPMLGERINYTHPTYISLVLLSGLISGLYLNYKKPMKAVVGIFELIVYGILLFATTLAMESRVGQVAFLVVSGVSLLYYVKIKTKYFRIVLYVGSLVAVILAFLILDSGMISMSNDKPRQVSYHIAAGYAKNHLWWGSGTGEQQIALLEQQNKMPGVVRPFGLPPYLYSHNQFLGDMVQFGIWGPLMLLILLSGLIYFSIQKRNFLLQQLLLLYTLIMMIEEPFYIQEGIMRFMLFFCVFLAVGLSGRERKSISITKNKE